MFEFWCGDGHSVYGYVFYTLIRSHKQVVSAGGKFERWNQNMSIKDNVPTWKWWVHISKWINFKSHHETKTAKSDQMAPFIPKGTPPTPSKIFLLPAALASKKCLHIQHPSATLLTSSQRLTFGDFKIDWIFYRHKWCRCYSWGKTFLIH